MPPATERLIEPRQRKTSLGKPANPSAKTKSLNFEPGFEKSRDFYINVLMFPKIPAARHLEYVTPPAARNLCTFFVHPFCARVLTQFADLGFRRKCKHNSDISWAI